MASLSRGCKPKLREAKEDNNINRPGAGTSQITRKFINFLSAKFKAIGSSVIFLRIPPPPRDRTQLLQMSNLFHWFFFPFLSCKTSICRSTCSITHDCKKSSVRLEKDKRKIASFRTIRILIGQVTDRLVFTLYLKIFR